MLFMKKIKILNKGLGFHKVSYIFCNYILYDDTFRNISLKKSIHLYL